MNINATGAITSIPQMKQLEAHYKKEGYNTMLVARRNKVTGEQIEVNAYWAVDWQVWDTTVSGLIRFKILYVGNPTTFHMWQKEIEKKMANAEFKPLEMKAGPEVLH